MKLELKINKDKLPANGSSYYGSLEFSSQNPIKSKEDKKPKSSF